MFDINLNNVHVELLGKDKIGYSYNLKGDEKRLTIAAGKIFRNKYSTFGEWKIENDSLILILESPQKMSFEEIKKRFTKMVTV